MSVQVIVGTLIMLALPALAILPLPSGLVAFIMVMNAVTGDPVPGLRGDALMLMFAFPTLVFLALWGFFIRRLSA
jgi:hypothetical protein